ncbi:MAG: hypothetical protein EU550_01825 [Promethearchaeota archaeon]|nr:MAG: hypothetical protein EU550_01825 [Candidatus Lokiarchaeota archaeon]
MVEFCEKCGSMMLPSKESELNRLRCNLCGKEKAIDEEIVESYVFNKVIKDSKKNKL